MSGRVPRLAVCLWPVALGSCVAPRATLPPVPAAAAAPMARVAPPAPSPLPAADAALVLDGAAQQGALLRGRATVPLAALTLDGERIPFAPDGSFLVGFGRDAVPRALLAATTTDGRALSLAVAVAPRQWDIQSLPTLAKGTPTTPEQIARRKAEIAQIVAARGLHPASDGWRQPFLWPVTGRISTTFGSQRIYAGEPGDPHSGVDVARPEGTPVVAPADGVVVLAAALTPFSLEGHLLMVDHGMGLTSAFLHLSRIDVAAGEHVVRGQRIGAVGMTGRATGPHLHWGLVWQGRRVDPQLFTGSMPSGD